MSFKLALLRARMLATSAVAAQLCLALSACGGDGTSVASIPPPPIAPTPTPTPTPAAPLTTVQGYSLKGLLDVHTNWLDSPATRNGNYDLIGRLSLTPSNGGPSSSRVLAPGEFNLTLTNPGGVFNYTLTTPSGILPLGQTSIGTSIANSWEINPTVAYQYDNPYASFVQDLGQRLTAFDKAANGTETQLFSYDFTRGSTSTLSSLSEDRNLRTNLDYDIGYSYVAMGEWSWQAVDLNGKAVTGSDSGQLLFVNGDRTPASGIPVSGTATYDARTLFGWVNVPFALTADFGRRTMSTSIDQDYRYNPQGDSMDDPLAFGIHVSGSAPFSNDGLFNIPLTGTANWASSYAINTPVAPASESVTGSMDGAFFGPSAEQVGGTFFLNRSSGVQLMQDAFVGKQH